MKITPRKVTHMAMRTDESGTTFITEWERDINGTRYYFTAFMWKGFRLVEAWRDGDGRVHKFGNL